MEAIAEGSADYAVLPIENSSAGIVADNYDLLVNFENYIVGEQRKDGARTTGTLAKGGLCYILADGDKDWIFVESG